MGIWRVAGAFAVAQRQSECGSKNLRNARQPANGHRRVLWGVFFLYVFVNCKFYTLSNIVKSTFIIIYAQTR